MIYMHVFILLVQFALLLVFKKELNFMIIDKIDYKKIKKRDLFSPCVMDIYVKALENPVYFTYSYYTVDIVGSDIKIWTANEIDNRRFYTNNSSLKEEVKEMNSKLTKYDKIILDKLCSKVKQGELHLIDTFFEA